MNVQIQFVRTLTNDYLEDMVRKRLDKLKKKYDWIIQAQVILSHEKNMLERNKRCAIELSVPGENIFQSAAEETFERAIAESFDNLQRLLRKHKAKLYPHL